MNKISLRLKHLTQEHRAAMLLAHAARDAMPQKESELPSFVLKVCVIFRDEMEPHFREEERFAAPTLRDLGRDDLADRTVEEHAHIRHLLADLFSAPSGEKVRAFSAALEAHVAFEETIVWEVLDAAMDGGAAPHDAAKSVADVDQPAAA